MSPSLSVPRCRGLSSGKHSRDPRMYGIRKKAMRFEVRIAGGKSGHWIYLGIAPTLAAAIELRDNFYLGIVLSIEPKARAA